MRPTLKAEPKRLIDGILLVNKPIGLTSNAVLQRVKHIFNAKKAGHTGSLDPMATGMLPICFGEATKFCQYLLDADKNYEATGKLGEKTNTGDATGEVIAQCDTFDVKLEQLCSVLAQFSGEIKQVPSMFSALKHQGKPLYRYARAGVEIERAPRSVHIRRLELNDFDGKIFKLSIACSKGTYVRNLIEDIGECLGVGAHVTQLHRTFTMGFADEPMYSLEELSSKSVEQLYQCLLPMDRAVSTLPKINLQDDFVHQLRQGRTVNLSNVSSENGIVRLYSDEAQFIGLGEIEINGLLKVKRLLANES